MHVSGSRERARARERERRMPVGPPALSSKQVPVGESRSQTAGTVRREFKSCCRFLAWLNDDTIVAFVNETCGMGLFAVGDDLNDGDEIG